MKAPSIPLLCILLLGACQPDGPQPLVGTLERDRIELAAHRAELVAEIAVEEGAFVKEGELVVRLDSADVDTRLAEARGNRDAASARLAELVRGPRRESITEARASLARTAAERERAEHHYQRIKRLRADKLVSQSEMDEVVANRDASRARQSEAAARLESLLEGTTVEELDRARAELRAAEARIATLETERSRLIVRAPVAGWVDSLPYEVGERAPLGATLAVILAADAPFARVYVPGTMRAHITPGHSAQVYIDGRPEALKGRVAFISIDASFTPFFALTERDRSRLAYLTKVRIDDPDAVDQAVGMPVEVRFTERE